MHWALIHNLEHHDIKSVWLILWQFESDVSSLCNNSSRVSSLSSALEGDKCSGDAVPDWALLQGECRGVCCQSTSSYCGSFSSRFPFLNLSFWFLSRFLCFSRLYCTFFFTSSTFLLFSFVLFPFFLFCFVIPSLHTQEAEARSSFTL